MAKTMQIAAGFLILGIGGYLAFAVINWLFATIGKLDPGVGAAIVAGATTIISSVLIASYNARKARERIAQEANREQKAKAYMEFMDTIIKMMKGSKAGVSDDPDFVKDLEEFFYSFTSTIAVYGGPGVVKAYGDWRSGSTTADGMTAIGKIDTLIRAMRSDLGESNWGIEANELLCLFIIGGKSGLIKDLASPSPTSSGS